MQDAEPLHCICCARPLLSLLRPTARLSKIEELLTGGGPWGGPKKRPWTNIRGAEIPACTCARWQTDIDGRRAARWRGPWGGPKKSGLRPLFGGAEIPARAARPQLSSSEERAGGGHQGAPKKRNGTPNRGPRYRPVPAHAAGPNCWPQSSALVKATKAPRKSGLGPLFGVMRTRAFPAKSGAS